MIDEPLIPRLTRNARIKRREAQRERATGRKPYQSPGASEILHLLPKAKPRKGTDDDD